MNIPAEFTSSSDEDLLRWWINKSELSSDATRALQFEMERRHLAKVVYTTAGLPRVELLRTPPVTYERKAWVPKPDRSVITRLLFMASGVCLAVLLRLSIPLMKNPSTLGPLLAVLAGIVLIPLVVFLVLNKLWKPFAPLVSSIVVFVITASLFWHGTIGPPWGRQLRKGIERSALGLSESHQNLQQALDSCRLQDISEILVTPDKLTQTNLADAESRLATAKSLLEDYGKQRLEEDEWVRTNLQPSAEKSRGKEWGGLKELLSTDSQWLEINKEFVSHVSEFVRYMRYYHHLYKVVDHKIVFSGADSLQNYEYYRSGMQQYAERKKKLDAAVAIQMRQFDSKYPARAEGS